ncbi:Ras-related GTP-binding protein A [Papilio machaon]|uniref:Ras-related GTP-binding protein A n=1 Tax=Papilio machaon TaxID=76193 RepID=A0A0N1IDF9_PAPMA|nr:Ras-related GTP-binding protein A [Papilio machaon]
MSDPKIPSEATLINIRNARKHFEKLEKRIAARLRPRPVFMYLSAYAPVDIDPTKAVVLSITDSLLCRACMGDEETASHMILHCPAVYEYRVKHLRTPRTLPEITDNIKGLLGFLESWVGWNESRPCSRKIRASRGVAEIEPLQLTN